MENEIELDVFVNPKDLNFETFICYKNNWDGSLTSAKLIYKEAEKTYEVSRKELIDAWFNSGSLTDLLLNLEKHKK